MLSLLSNGFLQKFPRSLVILRNVMSFRLTIAYSASPSFAWSSKGGGSTACGGGSPRSLLLCGGSRATCKEQSFFTHRPPCKGALYVIGQKNRVPPVQQRLHFIYAWPAAATTTLRHATPTIAYPAKEYDVRKQNLEIDFP